MFRTRDGEDPSRPTGPTITNLLEQAADPDPFRRGPSAGARQRLAHHLTRSGAQTPALVELTLDRRAIRDAALADPGQHLVDRLGPPPPSGPARDAWAAAATAIDSYRLRYHVTGSEPLGPRPESPELLRQWEHAQSLAREVERSQQIDIGHDLGL